MMIKPRLKTWLLAAMLGLATIALYWPATQNPFVNYDDNYYVSPNIQNGINPESIKWAFSNPVSGNWHPLTMLSLMMDYQLFGLQPWGFHLTNLLLHAINVILIFLLFQRLTGTVWPSLMVAALFACHPLHVESVAWVSERKDVLSACLGFLCLLFYAAYAQRREGKIFDEDAAQQVNGASAFYLSTNYWVAWFCLALGLMSKPMLVTWPFVLFLLDYWPLRRLKPGRSWPLIVEKIPFLILIAAASVVTYEVQKQEGAVKGFESLSIGMRVGNALISYCRYLGKIFWPADLAVFYPHPGHWPVGLVVLAGGLLAGLSAIFFIQRGRYPFLLVGWLWFMGTLVPVIGLVQVGVQAMADRYTYIPSVGVMIMIVWSAFELSRRGRWPAELLPAAGLIAISLCPVLTWKQTGYWKNTEILFRHALEVTEDNYTARNNLGNALLDENQIDAAINEFQKALQFSPENPEIHDNLGNALTKKGETEAAISQFQEAIHLKPDFAEAHNNLGNLLGKKGRTDDAITQYQEALRLKPDVAEVHYNFGNLLARTGRTGAAISQYEEAIRLNPHYSEARNNLGSLLVRNGQTGAAISQYQKALQLKPDFADAHFNLGIAFMKQGRVGETVGEFQSAIRLNPDYAPAHYYLGVTLMKDGQIEAAISQFQEAIRLKPDYAIARKSLAQALEIKNTPTGN